MQEQGVRPRRSRDFKKSENKNKETEFGMRAVEKKNWKREKKEGKKERKVFLLQTIEKRNKNKKKKRRKREKKKIWNEWIRAVLFFLAI